MRKARLPALPARSIARDDRALSHTHATLLMVAITVILALLVLLLLLGWMPPWSWANPSESLPPIIIIDIDHTSARTGLVTYAGRVFLLNNGSTVYKNKDLRAEFYTDGSKIATVSTLNGYLLIKSHHYRVRFIKGEGCRGRHWNPGEIIEVDLADENIFPGKNVTVEIVNTETKKVISKHTVVA